MGNIPSLNLSFSQKITNFIECISAIQDPRIKKKVTHPLTNIIVIIVFSILGGANNISSIEHFGKLHIDWFRSILDLQKGIPSHDTFGRILRILNPRDLRFWLDYWLHDAINLQKSMHLAMDGKEDNANQFYCLRLFDVSNQRVVLHSPVLDGSNEITTAKTALDGINLSGSIISGDAIFAQKFNARNIVDNHGDYLFTLKSNQPQLYSDIKLYLDDIENNSALAGTFDKYTILDKAHGRIEKRICITTSNIGWLYQKKQWKKLKSISSIECFRTIKNRTIVSKRYYISSLESDAKKISSLVRQHWSIENHCHNKLDTIFDSDRSTIKDRTACLNFAIIKDFVLSLLVNNATMSSIHQQRLANAFQFDCLAKTLYFS